MSTIKITPKTINLTKSNAIYDDVDFDYPTCGGYIITKGSKYLTIEIQSNYQGNRTDCRARLPLASKTAQAIIAEIESNDLDLDYLQTLDYTGGHIVQ